MKSKGFIGAMKETDFGREAKIDLVDRKILTLLQINGRLSINSLAKELNLGDDGTKYRVDRLMQKGIISGFVTLVNLRALGYLTYDIHLKLKNTSWLQEKRLIDRLCKLKEIIWVARLNGDWDLGITIVCKNMEKFHKAIADVHKVCKNNLKDYNVLHLVEEREIPGNFLGEEISLKKVRKSDRSFYHDFNSRDKAPHKGELKLDAMDYKILDALSDDARINLLDLSNKLEISRNTTPKRISRLIRGNVISDFVVIPSYSLLGLEWNMLFLRFKNFSPDRDKAFLAYIKKHPDVHYYVKYLGNWHYQLTVISKNAQHFNKTLHEIKHNFKDVLEEHQTLRVFNQYKYLSKPSEILK